VIGFRQERPPFRLTGPLLRRFVDRIRGHDVPDAPLAQDATSL
jgi:hypothetical protein